MELTGGKYRVKVQGEVVSSHLQFKEAVQSASDYPQATIIRSPILVENTGSSAPAFEPEPEPEPDPTQTSLTMDGSDFLVNQTPTHLSGCWRVLDLHQYPEAVIEDELDRIANMGGTVIPLVLTGTPRRLHEQYDELWWWGSHTLDGYDPQVPHKVVKQKEPEELDQDLIHFQWGLETELTSHKYDLTKFNPTFWDRVLYVMEEADKRGIVVQATLFDPWDLVMVQYLKSPWHPFNNVNYYHSHRDAIEQYGLPDEIDTRIREYFQPMNGDMRDWHGHDDIPPELWGGDSPTHLRKWYEYRPTGKHMPYFFGTFALKDDALYNAQKAYIKKFFETVGHLRNFTVSVAWEHQPPEVPENVDNIPWDMLLPQSLRYSFENGWKIYIKSDLWAGPMTDTRLWGINDSHAGMGCVTEAGFDYGDVSGVTKVERVGHVHRDTKAEYEKADAPLAAANIRPHSPSNTQVTVEKLWAMTFAGVRMVSFHEHPHEPTSGHPHSTNLGEYLRGVKMLQVKFPLAQAVPDDKPLANYRGDKLATYRQADEAFGMSGKKQYAILWPFGDQSEGLELSLAPSASSVDEQTLDLSADDPDMFAWTDRTEIMNWSSPTLYRPPVSGLCITVFTW